MTELSGKRSKKALNKNVVFIAITLVTILIIAVGIMIYNDSTNLKSIVFSADSMLMKVDGKDSMTFTSDPVDYDMFKLKWTSSDVKVASVTESGIVTGMTVGKTTITAQGENKVADSFTVEVVDDNCPLNPTADRVACLDKNRVINLMPDFEGFEKVEKVIDGYTKYVYIAKAGNRYEVSIGEIGGYYKEEVTFEGEKVGGIAFVPKIVEKLLADKDDKAIFIPADISEINNKDNITLSLETVTFQGRTDEDLWLKIDTSSNNVSISNPTTDSSINNRCILMEGAFDDLSNCITPIIENKNKYAFQILGNFIFNENYEDFALLGQKMTETKKKFGLTFIARNDNELRPIKKEEILKVGNSIIFLKDLD